MPDVHREVPTLAILLPFFVAAASLVLLHLRRSGAATPPRLFIGLTACAYGAAVLYEVLLPFTLVLGPARSTLMPWHVFVQLVPITSLAVDPSGIILNIELFVPFGLLVPLVTPVRGLWRVAFLALLVSLGIETLQFLLDLTVSTGRVADIDDVIGNVTGALVGVVIYRLMMLIPFAPRIASVLAFPLVPGSGGA